MSDHIQSKSCYFQYLEYSKHLPLRYSDWARVGVVKVLLLRLLDTNIRNFLCLVPSSRIELSHTEIENALKVTSVLSPSFGRVKTAKSVGKKICVIAV